MTARPGIAIPQPRPWTRARVAAVQAGLVAGVLAAWELGVRGGAVDPFFWSSPSAVWRTALIYLPQPGTAFDVWFTVSATLAGFALGTVGGAAIGLSFWWAPNWASVFEPILVVFNAIPKLAFAPLLILLFGIGITSKIALAAALTVVVTALAAHGAVRALDPDLVRLMYSLGATRWQVFTKVVLPSAASWLVASMRVNIGLALTGTIVGEFVSSQHGIGKVIMYAGSTYEMSLIWVGIVVLSLIAVLMYAAVGWMERRLTAGLGSS